MYVYSMSKMPNTQILCNFIPKYLEDFCLLIPWLAAWDAILFCYSPQDALFLEEKTVPDGETIQ